jgi:DNA-binding NtrC family response regulator
MTKILYISAEKSIVNEQLSRMLKKMRYEVENAKNGTEILTKENLTEFDVIVIYTSKPVAKISETIKTIGQFQPKMPTIISTTIKNKSKKGLPENIEVCSGDFTELLFCIENVLEKSKKPNEVATAGKTGLLTDAERDQLRKKRHENINKERFSKIVVELLSKK